MTLSGFATTGQLRSQYPISLTFYSRHRVIVSDDARYQRLPGVHLCIQTIRAYLETHGATYN